MSISSMSSYNNTNTPLLNNAEFYGNWEDVSKFTSVWVNCYCDTSCNLFIQSSADRIHTDTYDDSFSVSPNQSSFQTLPTRNKYARIYLINSSGQDQTILRLTTFFKSENNTVKILDANSTAISQSNPLEVNVNNLSFDSSGLVVDISGQMVNNSVLNTMTFTDGELNVYANTACIYGSNDSNQETAIKTNNSGQLYVDVVNFPSNQTISGVVTSVMTGSNSGILNTANLDSSNNLNVHLVNPISVSNFPSMQLVFDLSANYLLNSINNSLTDISGDDSFLSTISTNTLKVHNDISANHSDLLQLHNDLSGNHSDLLRIHNDVSGLASASFTSSNLNVNVSNFPSTQTVLVSNQPSSMQVSNFPSIQLVFDLSSNYLLNSINNSLTDISGDDSFLSTISTNTLKVHNDISANHSDLLQLHNDISANHSDLLQLHNDISGNHSDLLQLHNDISGNHADLLRIHNDVSGLANVSFTSSNLNVNVSNFPSTQAVSGTVSVSNQPSSISVSNFPSTQPVSGSVSVSNFPSTQAVSGTVSVSNQPSSIQVSNFPSLQNVLDISGYTLLSSINNSLIDISGEASYLSTIATNTGKNNYDSNGNQLVSVANSSMPVSGSVSVSNFPSTQAVSGTVSVSNQPSSISVSNFPSTQPVSGSVSVSNFPSTQAVSGTVSVSNQPSSMSVSNFPSLQNVLDISGYTLLSSINNSLVDISGEASYLSTIATNTGKANYDASSNMYVSTRYNAINYGWYTWNEVVSSGSRGTVKNLGSLIPPTAYNVTFCLFNSTTSGSFVTFFEGSNDSSNWFCISPYSQTTIPNTQHAPSVNFRRVPCQYIAITNFAGGNDTYYASIFYNY